MPKERLGCNHPHGAMGVIIFTYIPHHHESLDTHCPLDVSQECFDEFRKLVGIPLTWRDMKIQVGCVKEGDTYFLLCFVHLVDLPHSIGQPVSAFPAFPPCSGL